MNKIIVFVLVLSLVFLSSCSSRVDYESRYEELQKDYYALEEKYDDLLDKYSSADNSDYVDPHGYHLYRDDFHDYEDAAFYIVGYLEGDRESSDKSLAISAAFYLVEYINGLYEYCSK